MPSPVTPRSRAEDASATPEALAPLPEVAQGPAINEQGYATEEIGGGLHAVTDGVYQAMFLVTDQGVVVDAPPTIGANLLRAITHVIYSHSHADHIGAAVLYPAEAIRIAHEETDRFLAFANDPPRPFRTRRFVTRTP